MDILQLVIIGMVVGSIIGLGAMGSLMAEHLLKKQFSVVGYDIQSLQNNALDELGLKQAASPKDVAEQSDILITSLPSPRRHFFWLSRSWSRPDHSPSQTSEHPLRSRPDRASPRSGGGTRVEHSPRSYV